jgi:hypothetical protein
MNERIRELAEQIVGPSRLHGGELALMGNNQVEKFSELIIRECAFVAQNKDDTNIDLRYGRGLAAGKILEHFGY